jgi:hypothetical protein
MPNAEEEKLKAEGLRLNAERVFNITVKKIIYQ